MKSLALFFILLFIVPAVAQQPPQKPPSIPSFWDAKRRPEKPPPLEQKTFRFITEGRFPPFNFQTADGALVGFEIDLARLICEELSLTCTIQIRVWEDILTTIARGEADAAIAALAITPEARRVVDFSDRYLANPARFAVRADSALDLATPETLSGLKIAVAEGTAHAEFLKTFFESPGGAGATRLPFPSRESAFEALRNGQADALFADAVSLSTWLNGEDSRACCRFLDGAYTESAYFGEGLGVALPKNREAVRFALNAAMGRIHARGLYDELYLRYFPLGLY